MSIQPTSIAPTPQQGVHAPVKAADSASTSTTRTTDTTGKESVGQRILAQVVGIEPNTVSVKVPADGRLLQLQSNLSLTKGQLVLLEFSGRKGNQDISLQTTGRPLTDQILRLLVPHLSSLKTISQNVLASQHAAPLSNTINTTSKVAVPNLASNTTTGQSHQNNTQLIGQTKSFLGFLQQLTQSLTNLKSNTALTNSTTTEANLKPHGTPSLSTNQSVSVRQSNSADSPTKLHTTTTLLESLSPTSQFQQPTQAATLLQPGLTPPLLKLLLPMLRSQLDQAPTNTHQQQARDSQITSLTQLAARVLLGALRSGANANETEVSRNEWLTRFEHSIDTLQVELNIVREPTKDKNHEDKDNASDVKDKIRQWRVRLAFEFEELGLVTAFILLSAEQKMEVQFWCEQQQTLEKIRRFRSEFSAKLDSAITSFGIDQLEVGVFDGTPPASKHNLTTQLIDETA